MIKKAGVILGINDGNIILTKRSSSLRSFTGHVCLPGGKYDDGDDSIIATALREFHEEVQFSGEVVPLFCMEPESSVVSGHEVFPIIAQLNGNVYGYNSAEVEKIISLRLDDLNESIYQINPEYPQIKHNKCFSYDGEFVWGLTAHILFKFTKYYKQFFEKKL